jgi:tyrosyl-tRNA synthetase
MVEVGMQPTKAAVRRMIKGGGVRINNEKVEEELYEIKAEDVIDGKFVLLAAGKKNKMLIECL